MNEEKMKNYYFNKIYTEIENDYSIFDFIEYAKKRAEREIEEEE